MFRLGGWPWRILTTKRASLFGSYPPTRLASDVVHGSVNDPLVLFSLGMLSLVESSIAREKPGDHVLVTIERRSSEKEDIPSATEGSDVDARFQLRVYV
jgi:hypothetical protein